MKYEGCLLWILFAFIWAIIGLLSYQWHKPDTFLSSLLWVFMWQMYTLFIDICLVALRVLVEAFKKTKYTD